MREFTDLREAHVHLAEFGEELSAIDLSTCASLGECLERMARAAAEDAGETGVSPVNANSDGWIIAVRARVEGWAERRWPTASELHEAANGRPCLVKSFDIHSLVASTRALDVAGIEPDRPATNDPASDLIERDESGRPTGLLLETMAQRMLSAAPAPTRAERREHVRLACENLAQRGYIEAHDMLSRPWLGPILAELDDEGALPVRVLLHPVHEDFDRVIRERPSFERDRVRIGGLKVFTDGTLNSRTAWMLEPFADPRPEAPNGHRMMTDSAGTESIERALACDLPLVAHAIGDAAVRWCLDLIEAHSPKHVGHRIEHCEFVDEVDVPRFAALGVIASLQPCHLLPDMEALERLTPHRLDRVLPIREFIESARAAGRDPAELIWFGSDAPVVDPDPEDTMQAAVMRRRPGMTATRAVAPAQAITREDVLSLFRAPRASQRSATA